MGLTPPNPPPDERLIPVYSEDWGRMLEAAHDAYMERLYANVDRDIWDHEPDPEAALDVTGAPFCGCETCERRASWTFLMVWIMEAHSEGVIEVEERKFPKPKLRPIPGGGGDGQG